VSEVQIFSVTKKMLWALIKAEQERECFSVEGAIASYVYDLSRGKIMSQREYAKCWSWTHKKVRYHWENIALKGAFLWERTQGHTWGTPGAQETPKSGQNQNNGAHEGHTKGTQLINTNRS